MRQGEGSRPAPPRLRAHSLDVRPPGAGAGVIHRFSLDLAPGEWVAVAGSNGSGKTSLLHTLAGLWPPAGGTLELDGAPLVSGAGESLRSRIAVVLQDPSSQLIQPTVADELRFAATNLGLEGPEVDARVDRLARALGLEAVLDRDPVTLSAGRQQAVLLAAALVAGPALLLADEPGAHLDPPTRRRALDLVASEVARGLSVVWVTQDRAELEAAHRVVRLDETDPVAIVSPVPPPRRGRRLGSLVVARPGEADRRVEVDRTLEIELPERGLLALVGPNGAGKSILLAAIAGLEPLEQVSITWDLEVGPASVALQYPELQIFEEDVASELVFSATARGVSRSAALDQAAAALEVLGFDPRSLMKRRTWQLAGGERRIVEVVAALIAPARLVILDEPTAGIDPMRRVGLTRLIARRIETSSVLIASQDADWLRSLDPPTFVLGSAVPIIQVTT